MRRVLPPMPSAAPSRFDQYAALRPFIIGKLAKRKGLLVASVQKGGIRGQRTVTFTDPDGFPIDNPPGKFAFTLAEAKRYWSSCQIDRTTKPMHNWTADPELNLDFRIALDEVTRLLNEAYDAAGTIHDDHVLAQAGLRDGQSIVIDYLIRNEAGVAFDHLMYMIKEPNLRLSAKAQNAVKRIKQKLYGNSS